jgi:hypothetical protein
MLAIKDDYNKRLEIDRICTLDAVLKDREVKKIMATQRRQCFYIADKWVKKAEYYENIVRNLGSNPDKKKKDST